MLGTPKRTYIFIAPTIKEKKTWEKLLHERIAVEKERFLEVAVVDYRLFLRELMKTLKQSCYDICMCNKCRDFGELFKLYYG